MRQEGLLSRERFRRSDERKRPQVRGLGPVRLTRGVSYVVVHCKLL